mmetsp:Transcript_17289/g.23318  ORF Transcript_17289/g.23318 Transcript_17289/m.23318 type:complete len:149 (+) Transcript_17289:174-620(+)
MQPFGSQGSDLLDVVVADQDMELCDLLANALLLVVHQTRMPLIIFLVFFQVNVLFESMEFLVELAADFDLCCKEVKFVRFLHFDVLIVAIDFGDDLFDKAGVSTRDHVIEKHLHEVVVCFLDGTLHVPHDELRRTLVILQVVFQRCER